MQTTTGPADYSKKIYNINKLAVSTTLGIERRAKRGNIKTMTTKPRKKCYHIWILYDHGVYGTRPFTRAQKAVGKRDNVALTNRNILPPTPRVETAEYRMQPLPPAGVVAHNARGVNISSFVCQRV